MWWNQPTGDVVVWMNVGAITPLGRSIITVSDVNWHPGTVGDFDGYGKADLFWRNVATEEAVVWLMSADSIKTAAYVTRVNDLNWSMVCGRGKPISSREA